MCVIAGLTAGLGVAAGDTVVSVTPQESSVDVGESTTINVTVDTADNGIGAYNITVETNGVATIQDVTLAGNPGFEEVTSNDSNTSVGVRAAVTDTTNTGKVTIVSVTLQGERAGETPVELTITELGDEDGEPYNVTSGQDGQLTVEQEDNDTGEDTGDNTDTETETDTSNDTGGDAGDNTNTETDTSNDTGGDTGDNTDTETETETDTSNDTGGDTGDNTDTETETDTSNDAGSDTATPTETATSTEEPNTDTTTETVTSTEEPNTDTTTETATSTEEPNTNTTTETATGIPGFSPLIALLALCVMALLAVRR
jgi:PGF-CTERM protein